jgi:hypothetical protein
MATLPGYPSPFWRPVTGFFFGDVTFLQELLYFNWANQFGLSWIGTRIGILTCQSNSFIRVGSIFSSQLMEQYHNCTAECMERMARDMVAAVAVVLVQV